MIMEVATFVALASQCAPLVAPDTLLAVARHESGLKAFVLHDNSTGAVFNAPNAGDAVRQARAWISTGRSVDLGLMQVNSANLGWLGVSVEDMFDVCRNVAAGATVLERSYADAVSRVGEGPEALRTALSFYNTGNPLAGFGNGYVAKVEGNAVRYAVPSIGSMQPRAPASGSVDPAVRPAVGSTIVEPTVVRSMATTISPTSSSIIGSATPGDPFVRRSADMFNGDRR